jgi:hypothetical protein
MYLRPALKFVELIASISTEDEMINCASTPAPWEVPFKLRVDCNTANTLGGWWRTGSAGSASRAQQWVLLPSHPCGYILELWNVLPTTSRGRRYPTGSRLEGSSTYRCADSAGTDCGAARRTLLSFEVHVKIEALTRTSTRAHRRSSSTFLSANL